MPHPKDEDVYPVETIVRIKKTGAFAVIKDHTFQHHSRGFLNYLAEIEGKYNSKGYWVLHHDEIELECLPLK
jgi:hypothetical protein